MKNTKPKLHNSNFMEACNNAVNGIIYATTTQSNIKKQLIIAVVVMILSLFYSFTTAEFLCLTFAVFLVIFAEMINTAIETVVDLYTDKYHPKAKIAKDVAAGAVVLMALNAVIVAYFLFFRETEIRKIGVSLFSHVLSSPTHLAFVAIILTIIAIVALKAVCKTDPTKGIQSSYLPSGQSSLAFAILTAIWINTQNVLIFTLALILSILVLANRLEGKEHSIAELIFSSAMGILIVLLVYGLTIFRI